MPQMRSFSLASGSSGNCIYVEYKQTGVLIDAGISAQKIRAALAEKQIDLANVRALLLTHEHSDHIYSALTLARRYHIPLYTNRKTYQRLIELKATKTMDPELIPHVTVETNERFVIGDLAVRSFALSHDAVDPMGFRIDSGRGIVSVLTDCGSVGEEIYRSVSGSDLVYLEANYDPTMLLNGPYSEALKYRIMGERGHLSNLDASVVLARLARDGCRKIRLAHLSETNNLPSLAWETVCQGAKLQGIKIQEDIEMDLCPRRHPSETVCLF